MKDLLLLFQSMLRIRRVEEALAQHYQEQEMRCPMHLCIGQEASAVGVCAALEKSDQIMSGHRAHGHYLAKGGGLKALYAELYGRATGCSGGRGGSMHLIDMNVGFLGSTPIVGGTVPIAVGAAWSAKLQNKNHVVVVFFGDGCFEEGVVHESMNFACLHKLPILFVCENNGYSVYTDLKSRQPDRTITAIADAHGLQTMRLDGNNVLEIYRSANTVVRNIRNESGPHFLELNTYRWMEHCGPNDDDHLNYRPANEVKYWKDQCPIEQAKVQLYAQGLLDDFSLKAMEQAIATEINEAFDYVSTSPFPATETINNHLFA
jgi:TPP-dependent pyruvate/acetoin dehydrogenase alpha subunit